MANPKLDIEITAKLDSLDRDFGRVSSLASDTARKVEGAFSGLGNSLKGIAGGLVAAFSVDMFAGIVKGSIDAQDRLGDLAKSTSLSVETLAGLGVAARKSGSNLEDIAGAITKLSVSMGKEPDKFREIGITAKDPIDALKQLADVFVAIKDPQERAAFAAAALGKSWAGTAPLLAEGGKAIGEMVEKGTRLSKVTAETAKAADELNDRLADLQTASQGTKTAFVNLLIPSMIETLKIMDRMRESGSLLGPILSGIGRQRLSFDADFAGSGAQIADLEKSLTELQNKKAKLESSSGGKLNEWLIGGNLKDINRDIAITTNQIALLKKYGDSLKPAAIAEATTGGAAPNVRKFLDGGGSTATQISEGQRLIDMLRDRMLTTQNLTEVEKLEAQFADDKYAKATAGEKEIALGIAAQIDARKSLTTELDAELDRIKKINKEYDAQDARLASLIASTDSGKDAQRLMDENLLGSALASGKIDLSIYDQAKAKLNEVKDTGKDAFKDLQAAIEGWGKSSANAIVDFAMTGKSSFSDMANSIISDMMRMVVQQNITGPMATAFGDWSKGLFSSSSQSNSITLSDGSIFGNATGGVYSSPGLSAYSGSVVSRPTVFPFASGIGLMGEAGAEAILPLKRGRDGKLGISGGSGVEVNIYESNQKAGQVQSSQDNGGKTIIDVFVAQVKSAIASDIGSGGMVASAMEGQYGLNRSAGAWR